MLKFLICITPLFALSEKLSASADAPLLLPSQADLNYRPVIGILSHPVDGAITRASSYIAASYVKFVESGGARVIPLIYNEPWKVLLKKLSLVNGVIFTGGNAKTGVYREVLARIFEIVKKKNDAENHFPLFAICLGFEHLAEIVSEDRNILDTFNARNQTSTLQFRNGVTIKETMFRSFPPDFLREMSTKGLSMQNHGYGVSPKKFEKSKKLSGFFEILTTSADKDGKMYVSTMKARKYPVTAVQWHPEKNAFEWGTTLRIPHYENATRVTQLVANFVVREARKSKQRPSSRLTVLDYLIYNYKPTYTGKHGEGFDQVYVFT